MNIKLYCKSGCCWTAGVKKVLQENNLEYEEIDVSIEKNFTYMVEETNQPYSPSLQINGEWVVDVGAKELEEYLSKKVI